jgi:tripartite-type tricarboxylate transporter receptor subunit TctC
MTRLISMALLAALAPACGAAGIAGSGDNYPARPIRLLVPYPAGGSFDIFARVIAQKLSTAFERQVVVDNRGGASGIIAAELVARAAPDGHTLLFGGAGTLSIQPALSAKLPYDAIRDFAPVSMVATAPHILVAHPALPVKNVQELIALAKAKPGALNYATGGSGGPPHLAAELFRFMTGADIVHVPYTGGAQATTATVGGQVQIYFSSMASALPLIKEGRLRGLGVTSAQRTAAAPEFPTIAEAGVPGYELLTWFAVVAPAATPKTIVARLNAEIGKAVEAADTRKRFLDLATDPAASTPEALGAFIKSEIAKWGKLIKSAGIRGE